MVGLSLPWARRWSARCPPWRAQIDSAVVEGRRRNHWGWGYEDQRFSPAEVRAAAGGLAAHLGLGEAVEVEDPVPLEAVALPAPRIAPPPALAEICANDVHARASHAWGKSYTDVVRGFRGSFDHPPDFVACPREEREVERLLEWCAAERVAAIPYGGGTSVVGGVRPEVAPPTTARSRSTWARWGRCWRSIRSPAPRASRRAPPGRRSSAQLGRARPHAAPLPPVLRALHAGGLDRDARGGALRDGVDAHRGLRGVRARDHARGAVGVAPASRLWCAG